MQYEKSHRVPTHIFHSTHRIVTTIDRILHTYAYNYLVEALTSEPRTNKEQKNIDNKTLYIETMYPEMLSYVQRKLIMALCAPTALTLKDRQVFDLSCNYKLASVDTMPDKSPMDRTEAIVSAKVYRYMYMLEKMSTRSLNIAWVYLKQYCHNDKMISYGLPGLKAIESKLKLKRKSMGFGMIIKNYVAKEKFNKLSKVLLKIRNYHLNNAFCDIRFHIEDKHTMTFINQNRLSFSRMITFSNPKFNSDKNCQLHFDDHTDFKKTLRHLENILTYHLKTLHFAVLKNYKPIYTTHTWNTISQYSNRQLGQQSMRIVNKYTSTRTIQDLSDVYEFMFNFITALIRNRLSRYFLILRYTSSAKKKNDIPLKIASTRTHRSSAITKTRMIFLVCHRLFKNNKKVAFDKITRMPKPQTPRMKVVYGRVKDLRRSCTPTRGNQTKRVSIVTNDASFRNFNR